MSDDQRYGNVFISYSHDDGAWLERLRKMLAPLERSGVLRVWTDESIEPGAEWHAEIRRGMAAAEVAVLLVSANFFASDYIWHHELEFLIEAAGEKGTRLLWVPIGESLYKKTPLGRLQAVCDPETPLEALAPAAQNQALVKVARKIEDALERASAAPVQPVPDQPPLAEPGEEAEPAPSLDEPSPLTLRLLEDLENLEEIEALGRDFLDSDRVADARVVYERLLELATPGSQRAMAAAYEGLGRVHAALGEPGLGRQYRVMALQLYRRLGLGEKVAELEGSESG